MLAKNSQAPRSFRKNALSLTFFASKLAPTGGDVRLTDWHQGKPPSTFGLGVNSRLHSEG
ncbi:hypothetical protein PspCFBP13509_27305 [Pseudomonas sp. CFBP13509]|nr:hypothetical protein PspCFBP13509_27305 [Pseudomonas sp. CFBP13509]